MTKSGIKINSGTTRATRCSIYNLVFPVGIEPTIDP